MYRTELATKNLLLVEESTRRAILGLHIGWTRDPMNVLNCEPAAT